MKIERPALDAALLAFAQGGHGLVLGQAGAGKTHSLVRLAQTLKRTLVPYVLLSVDELGDASEEDLRSSLGYTGTFGEQMPAIFAAGPGGGMIIFDGFDAARNEGARARLIHIIRSAVRRAPPGWSILVSVRNYDAAKSPALLEIFGAQGKAPPPEFRRSGVPARHFAVPVLTDDEVRRAVEQIPGLASAFAQASDGLRRLAHVPFNLWLLERVVRSVADPGRIGVLESETQLLDLFWTTHVRDTGDGDARILLLKEIVEQMVAGRRLTVPKADVFEPQLESAWRSLFSAEILGEGGPVGQRVSFGHNILFDYAVSVLLIDDTPEGLSAFLREDESRPLFLRPSLVYFFSHLWFSARPTFWSCFFNLLPAEDTPVRLVGRLIPPYVIVAECRDSTELTRLVESCRNEPEVGPQAVLRVLQALRFAESPDATIWAEFAEKISPLADQTFAWELGAFLNGVQDDPRHGGDTVIRQVVGRSARTLFEWAWRGRGSPEGSWYDAFAAQIVLPLVVKTFGTDPEANESIGRRVLGLLAEDDFLIRYMMDLAEGVPQMAPHAPALVADIYRGIFTHSEERETPTHMGGIVMSFRSNRRQDFSLCHYILAKGYPEFLQTAPDHAIPVPVYVLNAVSLGRATRYLKEGSTLHDVLEPFWFLGQERPYVEDWSLTWTRYPGEEEWDLADALTHYLTDPGLAIEPSQLVGLIANHSAAAATWSLLLKVGADAPDRYASLLHELALARPIQLGMSTLRPLGTFIEKAYEHWSPEQRAAFEKSVLELGGKGEAELADDTKALRVRDRLLARIPANLIMEPEARARVEELAAAGSLPSNEPLVRFSSMAEPFDEEEWFREQGVDPNTPENTPVWELGSATGAFGETWKNETPDVEAVQAVLPELRRAFQALTERENVGDPLVQRAWTGLAESTAAVAKARLPARSEAYELAHEVLTRVAGFPPPDVPADADETYTWPHWSPSARIGAAQGLAYLGAVDPTPGVLNALQQLARSPDPSERLVTLMYAPLIGRVATETLREIAVDRVENESNEVVATALFRILGALGEGSAPGGDLVRATIDRWIGTGSSELRPILADWLVHFALWRNDAWAWTVLRNCLAQLEKFGALLSEVNFHVINTLTPLTVAKPESADEIGRGVGWLVHVLTELRGRVATLRARTSGDLDQADQDLLGTIHKQVDEIVTRLYFNLRRHGPDPDAEDPGHVPTDDQLRSYYAAIKPVLHGVLRFSEPAAAGVMVAGTAHRFMELLNSLLFVDPPEILAMAADVSTAGRGQNFHLDSLAVREVVQLVETVLADHRDRIIHGKPLADMLRLLDIFADVGWPDALRLVWRLDEVFR